MNEQTNKSQKTKRLATSAVMIALATVLSMIKIYQLPMGGAVTLFSMLPIVMISLIYGTKWGLWTSFVYSVVQLTYGIIFDGVFGWGLTWYALLGTVFFDYIFAYTVIGISGFLKSKGTLGTVIGTALALSIRFIFHFISGVVFFGVFTDENTWIYSLTYNGSFMLPELIFTAVGAAVLFNVPQIKKIIRKQ